jgi:hypothetical protein
MAMIAALIGLYVVLTLIGCLIFIGVSESSKTEHKRFWMFYTVLWPIGLLLFLVWSFKQAWICLMEICDD